MKPTLIVLSFDALSAKDLERLKTKPGFRRFLEDASGSFHMRSVYPSLTYPAHASLVTGKRPGRHGVVDNTHLQPHRWIPDWYWSRTEILGDTLYDAALRHGMTTAALLWPVTGKAEITWNLPEVFSNRLWQPHRLAVLRQGTIRYLLEIEHRFGHLREGFRQPPLDEFLHASAKWTLREKTPNLTLVHYTDLDAMRHRYGYDSKEADAALARLDHHLWEMHNLVERTFGWADATLVVLGDHDQIPVTQAMHLNAVLKDLGLLKAKGRRVRTWKAYVKSLDGSAYVYVRHPSPALEKRLLLLLNNLASQEAFGIEDVLSKSALIRKGGDPCATFMLEAKPGWVFRDAHDRPLAESLSPKSFLLGRQLRSAHGYDPDKKDYHTVFLVRGRCIRKGIFLKEMSLLDVAPTLAAILGVNLKDTDGEACAALLHSSAQRERTC